MAKSANKGAEFERIIHVIQEALKDIPSTVIHNNYRIENTGGRKREIDIFIESKINGIVIKIAIECKAYKTPISVDKIEAFKAKCDRIPSINKKVFVSHNGYQADAIIAAKQFGIDLCNLSNISAEDVRQWIDLKSIGFHYDFKIMYIGVDISKNELERGIDIVRFIIDGSREINITDFVDNGIKSQMKTIHKLAIYELISSSGNNNGNLSFQEIEIPVNLQYPNLVGQDEEGKNYKVEVVDVVLKMKPYEFDSPITNSKVYLSNNVINAAYTSIPTKNDIGKTEVVITDDGTNFFYTDENGYRVKLRKLACFDPSKNEWDFTVKDR